MKKIMEKSFLEKYLDDFSEYFEEYKMSNLMKNTDYRKIYNKICNIKNENSNIRVLLEDDEKIQLTIDEIANLVRIFYLQDELTILELEGAFKLGFLEACKF